MNKHMVATGILPEQRGIFIHIPKTAGTTIYMHTGRVAPRMFKKHATALYVESKIPGGRHNFGEDRWLGPGFFTFAFVRNPWDRLRSMYRYLVRMGLKYDFDSWLDAAISMAEIQDDHYTDVIPRNSLTQKTYVTNTDGSIIVDFIGQVEYFKRDFDHICDKLDLPKMYKSENVSPPEDFEWSQENAEKVSEVCQWEIERFGYEIRLRNT